LESWEKDEVIRELQGKSGAKSTPRSNNSSVSSWKSDRPANNTNEPVVINENVSKQTESVISGFNVIVNTMLMKTV
jgi:hypothetical protein